MQATHHLDKDAPVAIVTGANGAIGRAICKVLRGSGWAIVACGLSETGLADLGRELERAGGTGGLTTLCFDLRDSAACAAAVTEVSSAIGRLDALVNNAAIWAFGKLSESTDEQWRDVLEVNVIAPVRLSRLCVDLLRRSPHPRIVMTASKNAFLASYGWSSYNVSKAALVAATRDLALELAEHEILVNAIAPGYVSTPSNSLLTSDEIARAGLLGRIPLGRLCEPDEVARAVAYLASKDCSYCTGTTLVLDGGYLAGEEEWPRRLMDGLSESSES